MPQAHYFDDDEIVDLVDDQDRPLRTVTRGWFEGLKGRPPGYIRAAEAFIVNGQGQILVPRRSAHKRIAPNGMDFSVAEHLAAGESYDAAIKRGFREELGLAVDAEHLRLVELLRPDPGMPYFRALYNYRVNSVSPTLDPDEATSWSWMRPQEVIDQVAQGDKAKSALVPAIKLVFMGDGSRAN